MTDFSARQRRAAVSITLSRIICKSKLQWLTRRSTSDIAVSCLRDSSRSRVSLATFVSLRAADELRGRTAFNAMRLLRVTVLRRCALAGSPPALDRRRIAAPRLRTRHLASQRGTLDGSHERPLA